MVLIAIIVSTLLVWSTSNVCKYNYAIEKKTNIMNIITEEIDPSMLPAGADGTPAMQDFIPGSITDCAVGNIVWSTIYAYDFEKMPNGPKTMSDFF